MINLGISSGPDPSHRRSRSLTGGLLLTPQSTSRDLFAMRARFVTLRDSHGGRPTGASLRSLSCRGDDLPLRLGSLVKRSARYRSLWVSSN